MSVRTDIEDAVRAWLVAAAVSGGLAGADALVIIADQDAVRPPPPYATVKVIGYDQASKEDWVWTDDADPPQWHIQGLRDGTVSVNAYGPSAEAWLERANLMLRAPSISAALRAAGFALRPNGGLRNLSGLVDTSIEPRFQRDYTVSYVRTASDTETEVVTPAEQVEVELDLDDRTDTVTEVL